MYAFQVLEWQLGKDYCSALLVFTGKDTTSAFKGIGKVKPLVNVFQKSNEFQNAFMKLGDDMEVNYDTKII